MPPDIQEATRIVRGENKASTALLQRRMNIGYAKAARLLDALSVWGRGRPLQRLRPARGAPQ